MEKPNADKLDAKPDAAKEDQSKDDKKVEGLSKNAQKKAAKMEEKLAKKEAKQVETKQGEGAKKKDDDEDEDPQEYYRNRCEAIKALKNDKEFFPFPHKFKLTHSIPTLREQWVPKSTQNGVFSEELVSVAGRVKTVRSAGKALVFYDIHGDDAKVQVMCNASMYSDPAHFERIKTIIKRGDFIGVTGKVGLSKTGEFSIAPTNLQLLSPCLHMIPKKENSLNEVETRYRKRYLDLIVNTRPKEIFKTRSKVISLLREEFNSRNFFEVETPVLNIIPGGATARPFETHHFELDLKMYMRIAPELYLKMCVVGGLDRVYEIGKNFRNEGIDKTHNPEFTSCELYWAYADYNDLMDFTEEVLCSIVMKIKGSLKFTIHDDEGKEVEIDFSRPWRRISIMEELAKILNVELPKDLDSDEANAFFDKICTEKKVICKAPRTTPRLIDKLVGEFIEPHLRNPTFLTEHPQIMCPLAKYHRSKPGLTERFELFINYKEFVNAYTELNDPFIQREQFEGQIKNKNKGDDEAQDIDENFIEALEHGLPPTGGWGLGIDRLVMLLTDSINIQEVIMFPAMKPKINLPASEVKPGDQPPQADQAKKEDGKDQKKPDQAKKDGDKAKDQKKDGQKKDENKKDQKKDENKKDQKKKDDQKKDEKKEEHKGEEHKGEDAKKDEHKDETTVKAEAK